METLSHGTCRALRCALYVVVCAIFGCLLPRAAALSTSDVLRAESPEFATHRKQFEYAAKLAASLSYDTDPKLILDVVAFQAQAWVDIGQADKLDALLLASTALAEQINDPMRLATARHVASRARYFQGEDRAAMADSVSALDAQRAVGESELQHPDPTRLYQQVMDHLSMLQGVGRDTDSVPLLRLADKILPRVRNPVRLSIALDYAYASLLESLGDRDASNARLEKALATATQLGDRGWQLELFNAISSTKLVVGDYESAMDVALKQLKLAQEDDNTLSLGHATLTLSESYTARGDFATGYSYAVRSRDFYDALDDSFTKADARREIARTAALLGRPGEARIALAEALRLRPENVSPQWSYHIARVRTVIAIASGDPTATQNAKLVEEERLALMRRDATTAQARALRDFHEVNERNLQLQLMQRDVEAREFAMKRDQTRIFWQLIAIAATSLLLIVAASAAVLLMRRSKSLKRATETDALTGAQSRAAILSYAQSLCTQATARQRSVAACVLDIDQFKRFNDQHGHATGDKILTQCVDVMKRNLRAGDRVGRIGGDEFLIVMDDVDESAAAATTARILNAVRNVPFAVGGHTLHASLSAGVAAFVPTARDTAKQLVQHADAALLRAKQTGKGKVTSFTQLDVALVPQAD